MGYEDEKEIISTRHSTENLTNIPLTDCLVLFGHSIGKLTNGQWRPSALLQPVTEVRTANDGFRIFKRTAQRKPISDTELSAIVGGGAATIIAAAEAYSQLERKGKAPKIIAFVGGRSKYLDEAASEYPNLTEAVVMQENFNKILERKKLPPPTEILQKDTKTTEDDVRTGLETAIQNDCTNVSFIGLGIRLPRCKAFYRKIVSETNVYNGITVNFIPVEYILKGRYERARHGKHWDKIWDKFTMSEGYKRTQDAELSGIKALQNGTYGQTMGGKGKT